jgi:penicillin-binding protein 2
MRKSKNKTKKPLFVLQNDGRLGDVHDDGMASIHQTYVDFEFLEDSKTQFLTMKIGSKRLRGFSIFMFVFFLLFLGRSAQLQIIDGEHYQSLSTRNRESLNLIVPPRGSIFDRYGQLLASNEATFTLTMTIADLPTDTETRNAQIEYVASIAGLMRTDIDLLISDFSSRPYDAVPIKEHLSHEAAIRLAIELAPIDAFDLVTGTKRIYHSPATSLSHVIGYTGNVSASELKRLDETYQPIDEIGKTGVEKTAEQILRGVPGYFIYEVDALGNRLSVVTEERPIAGADISLSIDLNFQKFIEIELQKTLQQVNASRGAVVAIDPQTGAVRALVSYPAFDSNTFIGGISLDNYQSLLNDPNQPLFPRAIAGEYPSGSTFKPFVAYAALAEGLVGEHTSFVSTGGIAIGQWFFPDWKSGGHGVTDARKAISESVNTYFYIIGGGFDTITGLGVERINTYASLFGFGTPTGIDLSGEGDGFLPTKEWKEEVKGERWYVGDTYHLAIGQGDFLTTPLQMAVATSVIANGGFLFEPYVVETVDGIGEIDLSKGQMIEMENLDISALNIVREGMRQTVTTGSARSLSLLQEDVAAKTGTAQTIGNRPYHSWFTGFAPFHDPNLTLVILIEEGGGSNDTAVPLAFQIYHWWFTQGMN